MTSSVSMQIHPSPAMATSLRSPLRPLLNPKWRSFANLRRPQPSPSLPAAARALPTIPSLKRRALGGFHSSSPLILTRAVNDTESAPGDSAVDEEMQARGESTLPERFRYLTKEAPDRPLRWPWAVALFFLIYAWKTVLWELSNWKKAAVAILSALGWLMKLGLAFLFRLIGEPITGLIRCIEYALYTLRYIYASIVAFAPVPELTRIILFTSTILAIAEATVPDSLSSQHWLLLLAGIIGFGAVRGFVPELLFWLILSGMFCYLKFIKKRDSVSAALPSAALLAAVGEPWVRGLTMASYLTLAIAQHANCSKGGVNAEVPANNRTVPLPLLLASLSIGIHLAAKWIRYRHLTWMIV